MVGLVFVVEKAGKYLEVKKKIVEEKKEEVENILLSLTCGDPEHGKWGFQLQQLRIHQLPKYAQKE